MAASRGWVPVFVLVVTTLIGCGDASQWEDGAPNGCSLETSDSRAVSMECDFSGLSSKSLRLRAGQLPQSIQTIRMSNAEEIFIANDTFSSLHSLKSIHLNDVRTLRIEKNNWIRIEQPKQVTITIDGVSNLSLHSGAFSGWSYPGPKIVIRNVTRCFISKEAFNSDSVIQRVVLQNIQILSLSIRAFQADVGHLELDNASLDKGCKSGYFRGRIRNLSLHLVRIAQLTTGCLNTGEGWADSLTIRSSDLGNIRPRGISGSVINVVIDDSRLGHVHEQGLHLATSTFTMNSTVVEELAKNALDVNFNQSASLQRSEINSLRANAFRGLKPLGDGATLTIRKVSVGEAENGSLALSKPTQVTLLDVELSDPCECGVDKQAHRLVVGDAPPRKATVRQVVKQVRCTAGTGTMTLAEFNCQNCSGKDVDIVPCSPPLPIRDWVIPVGVGTPLLLLLLLLALGAAVTMMKRPRRSRRREEHPPADQLRSDYMAQDVIPGPEYMAIYENVQPGYTESPEYYQREERHTSSAFGVPSSTDHPHAHQSESVYSEVYAAVLSRPPSSVNEYLGMTPHSEGIPGQSVDMSCDAVTADKQQHLYANYDAMQGGECEEPLYENLHWQHHH